MVHAFQGIFFYRIKNETAKSFLLSNTFFFQKQKILFANILESYHTFERVSNFGGILRL